MKTLFATLGLFLIGWINTSAQDLMVNLDDEEIIAEIQEVRKNKILYKSYDDLNGKVKKMHKSDLYMVIYEDGMKQYFLAETPRLEGMDGKELSAQEIKALILEGELAAEQYYKHRAAQWSTFGATVAIPVIGIFTGAAAGGIIAGSPSKPRMSELPDPDRYFKDSAYAQGFRKAAKREKVKRAGKGFLSGLLVQGFFILIITAFNN